MTPLEKEQFPFDTRDLIWEKVLAGFYYGIRRFYIKEDVVSPESGFKQLLTKNQLDWFHDIKIARSINQKLKFKDNAEYFPAVLSSHKF